MFAWPNWPRVKTYFVRISILAEKILILLFVLMAFSHVTIQYVYQSNQGSSVQFQWRDFTMFHPIHVFSSLRARFRTIDQVEMIFACRSFGWLNWILVEIADWRNWCRFLLLTRATIWLYYMFHGKRWINQGPMLSVTATTATTTRAKTRTTTATTTWTLEFGPRWPSSNPTWYPHGWLIREVGYVLDIECILVGMDQHFTSRGCTIYFWHGQTDLSPWNTLIKHISSLNILRQNKSWGCFVTRWVVRLILSIVGVDMISDFAPFPLKQEVEGLTTIGPWKFQCWNPQMEVGGIWFSFSLGWFLGSSG